jgi:hypothetical protein
MKRFAYLIPGLCAVFSLGACDDLGECDDPALGRTPVKVGTQVMYAGQAIIWKSCASGICHSEIATNRYGVPAGLDFDIAPVSASTVVDTDAGALGSVAQADLERLREHQRKVFDKRDSIWEQVKRDLMPPDGVGEPFRNTTNGTLITVSGGTCTDGLALGPITSNETREQLRKWLACGSPIVEANVPNLEVPAGGTVGDQFPACAPPGDPTFDNLYDLVLAPGCVTGCHEPGGSRAQFDLSTKDIAYASMVGPNAASTECDENPVMVTPNDPSKSYFYAMVGGEGGVKCSPFFMPLGSVAGLPAAELDLVKRWIEDGAPAPGVGSGGDAGTGDDASVGDAGL